MKPQRVDPIAEAARAYARHNGDGTIAQAQKLQRAFNAGAQCATAQLAPLVYPKTAAK